MLKRLSNRVASPPNSYSRARSGLRFGFPIAWKTRAGLSVAPAGGGTGAAVTVVAPPERFSPYAPLRSNTFLKYCTPAVVREARLEVRRRFADTFPSAVYWKKFVRLSCLKPVLVVVENVVH